MYQKNDAHIIHTSTDILSCLTFKKDRPAASAH